MSETSGPFMLEAAAIGELVAALAERGYVVVGPTVHDGAVVYEEIESAADLPAGWTDEQDGGTYRLRRRDDEALFGYAVGPHSWKRFLYPPRTLLWRARRGHGGLEVSEPVDEAPRYAFLGVRGCELAAIHIQDRVFLGEHPDRTYASRREQAFIVAVHCGVPAGTCFCASMGTGPRAGPGFDLALTELCSEASHRFLVEVGSERGSEVAAALPVQPATAEDLEQADQVVRHAAESMGRHMDTSDIGPLLARNLEHPRWADVAERCLACANCTMVCPTCFCSSVEDTSDLTEEEAERWRRWDSCFTLDFSHLGEGSVRTTTRSRYRQWMTHKLGTWIDQFGTSGCVGCGRCITWCPVGIDITEELAAIRLDEGG
jgi:ferredoxin